jgi:hypothetical protein
MANTLGRGGARWARIRRLVREHPAMVWETLLALIPGDGGVRGYLVARGPDRLQEGAAD